MNNNPLCRLEGFRNTFFENDQYVIKEKSRIYKRSVYVKYFHDLKLLKKWIVESTELWIRLNPEQERYLSYKEWENNEIKYLLDEKRDRYPGFLIYNYWDDYQISGFCYKGWFLLGNKFETYLNKYIL